jgi:hypothetical protein
MSNIIADIEEYEEAVTLEDSYNVERIVDRKRFKGKLKYLVKWENYPEDQNTWEPIENLENIRAMVLQYDLDCEKKQKEKTNKKNESLLSSDTEEGLNSEDKMLVDEASFEKLTSEFLEENLKESKPLSKSVKNKIERNGDINEDLPRRIIGAKILNNDPFELNCLLEWETKKGFKLCDSWVSSKMIKQRYPMILINYYEEKVKIKKHMSN